MIPSELLRAEGGEEGGLYERAQGEERGLGTRGEGRGVGGKEETRGVGARGGAGGAAAGGAVGGDVKGGGRPRGRSQVNVFKSDEEPSSSSEESDDVDEASDDVDWEKAEWRGAAGRRGGRGGKPDELGDADSPEASVDIDKPVGEDGATAALGQRGWRLTGVSAGREEKGVGGKGMDARDCKERGRNGKPCKEKDQECNEDCKGGCDIDTCCEGRDWGGKECENGLGKECGADEYRGLYGHGDFGGDGEYDGHGECEELGWYAEHAGGDGAGWWGLDAWEEELRGEVMRCGGEYGCGLLEEVRGAEVGVEGEEKGVGKEKEEKRDGGEDEEEGEGVEVEEEEVEEVKEEGKDERTVHVTEPGESGEARKSAEAEERLGEQWEKRGTDGAVLKTCELRAGVSDEKDEEGEEWGLAVGNEEEIEVKEEGREKMEEEEGWEGGRREKEEEEEWGWEEEVMVDKGGMDEASGRKGRRWALRGDTDGGKSGEDGGKSGAYGGKSGVDGAKSGADRVKRNADGGKGVANVDKRELFQNREGSLADESKLSTDDRAFVKRLNGKSFQTTENSGAGRRNGKRIAADVDDKQHVNRGGGALPGKRMGNGINGIIELEKKDSEKGDLKKKDFVQKQAKRVAEAAYVKSVVVNSRVGQKGSQGGEGRASCGAKRKEAALNVRREDCLTMTRENGGGGVSERRNALTLLPLRNREGCETGRGSLAEESPILPVASKKRREHEEEEQQQQQQQTYLKKTKTKQATLRQAGEGGGEEECGKGQEREERKLRVGCCDQGVEYAGQGGGVVSTPMAAAATAAAAVAAAGAAAAGAAAANGKAHTHARVQKQMSTLGARTEGGRFPEVKKSCIGSEDFSEKRSGSGKWSGSGPRNGVRSLAVDEVGEVSERDGAAMGRTDAGQERERVKNEAVHDEVQGDWERKGGVGEEGTKEGREELEGREGRERKVGRDERLGRHRDGVEKREVRRESEGCEEQECKRVKSGEGGRVARVARRVCESGQRPGDAGLEGSGVKRKGLRVERTGSDSAEEDTVKGDVRELDIHVEENTARLLQCRGREGDGEDAETQQADHCPIRPTRLVAGGSTLAAATSSCPTGPPAPPPVLPKPTALQPSLFCGGAQAQTPPLFSGTPQIHAASVSPPFEASQQHVAPMLTSIEIFPKLSAPLPTPWGPQLVGFGAQGETGAGPHRETGGVVGGGEGGEGGEREEGKQRGDFNHSKSTGSRALALSKAADFSKMQAFKSPSTLSHGRAAVAAPMTGEEASQQQKQQQGAAVVTLAATSSPVEPHLRYLYRNLLEGAARHVHPTFAARPLLHTCAGMALPPNRHLQKGIYPPRASPCHPLYAGSNVIGGGGGCAGAAGAEGLLALVRVVLDTKHLVKGYWGEEGRGVGVRESDGLMCVAFRVVVEESEEEEEREGSGERKERAGKEREAAALKVEGGAGGESITGVLAEPGTGEKAGAVQAAAVTTSPSALVRLNLSPCCVLLVRGSGMDAGSDLCWEGGSEGWVVECSCGTRDDDGEQMVACDRSVGQRVACDRSVGQRVACDRSVGQRVACDRSVGQRVACDRSVGQRVACDRSVGQRVACDRSVGQRVACDRSVGEVAACDRCEVWQHTRCAGFSEPPASFLCDICSMLL
ncbi:unnamed protein product [Closterium sp. NIES-65]|nr:unnamed protein product [Closterium sp. NIES-65]